MDMLMGEKIAEAKLTEWRKLAQGLHARYVTDGFTTGAAFVVEVGKVSDELGHHPQRVSLGDNYVDLKLVSEDALYRTDDGSEYVVEWPTQQDVDLARRITELAAEHNLRADPTAVSDFELGVDTADSEAIAPFWAVLLTGDPDAQGRGTPGDEVRDATRRVPNIWFGDPNENSKGFHLEVYLAPEVVNERIAAAVAAGGTVVDDSESPGLTVLADKDGNRGIICADTSAAAQPD